MKRARMTRTRPSRKSRRPISKNRPAQEPLRFVDYPLSPGRWYPEPQAKKYIIWHGTQGRTAFTPVNGRPGVATSSIDGWNQDEAHVGTPFLIDRDGAIYRTFKDEREWIFHLGLANTKGRYDRASIGIEFANELDLIAAGGKFYAFDRVHPNTEYVGPRIQRTWRAHDWWAGLDEAQVDAAIQLTLELCVRHGIPKTFYYPSTTYDFPRCFEVASVLCHSNCREDKTDLLLEDWIWAKLRAAGFQLVGGSDAVSTSHAMAVSAPLVVSTIPIDTTLEVRPVAPLGRAKVTVTRWHAECSFRSEGVGQEIAYAEERRPCRYLCRNAGVGCNRVVRRPMGRSAISRAGRDCDFHPGNEGAAYSFGRSSRRPSRHSL